jgi:nucleotide-binding universal stress UspA family protein
VAASLATRYDAQVTVIHVFTPIPKHFGEPNFDEAVQKALGESRQMVEDATRRLQELGVARTDCDVIGDAAADVILTVADTRRADLIVLGAHGVNRLQSILLGSVSMTVAQRAQCPVLLVK